MNRSNPVTQRAPITGVLSDAAIAAELYWRIEQQRKLLGVSQLALAERLGITPKTYRNLKTGACSLTVFLMVLRELNLLENLEYLVPTQQQRPSEFFNRGESRKTNVAEALKARKKIK